MCESPSTSQGEESIPRNWNLAGRYIAVKRFFNVGPPIFCAHKDVRHIALWILNELGNKKRTLDFLFEIVHNKRSLSQKDRSLLQALVFGVFKMAGFSRYYHFHIFQISVSKK